MSTTYQIVKDGCIYVFSKKEYQFEVTVEKIRKLLQGTSKATTFDALHKGIAETWLLRDDLVKPFGDKRQALRFVCTCNLDEDLLSYEDENDHIQIPLDRVRKTVSDPLQRSEFTPFEIASPPQLDLAMFPPPYQKPLTVVPQRHLQFCSRVLTDFAHQWCHILRSSYSEITLRRLAKAIVMIATCNFRVDEASTREHIYFRGYYVTVLDVPSWDPYERQPFSVGGTTIILNQSLQNALNIAKDDTAESSKAMKSGDRNQQRTYLLLSVRHMLVCHVDSAGIFSYTAPMTLMDGLSAPSPSAITLLLQALAPSRAPPLTVVHKLPLEIQDRILENVSEGSVEAARLGCVLGLGSLFRWMRYIDWPRRDGPIELFISPSHRHDTTPVESKIRFGNKFSGVSYR